MHIGSRGNSKTSRARGAAPTEPFDVTSLNADIVLPEHRSGGRPKPRPTTTRELADEIDGLAASLTSVDPRATERLRDLAGSLGTEEGRLRWADVDLRQAFHSEYLAHFYAVRREGGFAPKSVEIADNIRNSLVLAPVFLTWLGLWEATKAYGNYLDANPNEAGKSFLYLWQKGFGGEGSWIATSFSTLALADAMIILFIFALTVYSHGRRERQEEKIARTAQKFQADIDNVLAEATVALAPDRAGRPAMLARSVERLAERFEHNSQELLARLRVEHDRLEAISDRREREFADFGVFASGMRAGAEETHRLLIELRQVSTGLHQALDDMTAEVGVAGDQQKSLLTAVTSLERLVATGIQSDHGVTRKIAEAAQVLTEAAERSLAGAEAAAQAGRVASEAVRGIAEISSSLVTGHNRVEHAIAAESEANARLADALRSGMTGVTASSRSLGDIQTTLQQMRDEFHHIAQLNQDHAATLSRMLSEQSSLTAGLASVARELTSAGSETSLQQRTVSGEIATLVRRLDTLAQSLARGPREPFEPSPAQPVAAGVRNPLKGAPDPFSDDDDASRRERSPWPRRGE